MREAAIFTQALTNEEGLKVLKQALTENGFKHTPVAANIMLTEMDLPDDISLYYQTLSLRLEPEDE